MFTVQSRYPISDNSFTQVLQVLHSFIPTFYNRCGDEDRKHIPMGSIAIVHFVVQQRNAYKAITMRLNVTVLCFLLFNIERLALADNVENHLVAEPGIESPKR